MSWSTWAPASPSVWSVARTFGDDLHDYAPDSVTVSAGNDPFALPVRAEVNGATNGWVALPLPATVGRYVSVRFTKTRNHDFADYLFLDEITAQAA